MPRAGYRETETKMSRRLATGVLFLCLLGLLKSASVCAAENNQADLYVWPHANSTSVELVLPQTPPDMPGLETALAQSIGGPLSDIRTVSRDGKWIVMARCEARTERGGAVVKGRIDLTPLLKPADSLGLDWVTVSLHLPGTPGDSCSGARREAGDPGDPPFYYAFRATDARSAPPIPFAFGYTGADAVHILWPAAPILLLPVLLTLFLRRNALRARNADPAAVWFGYTRFFRAIAIGMWGAWLFVMLGSARLNLLTFLSPAGSNWAATGIFAITTALPPMAVQMACAALSQAVFARVRGVVWTPGELAMQTFWMLAMRVAPAIGVSVAIVAANDSDYRVAVIALVAGVVGYFVTAWRWARAADLLPVALTVGELRDRVFALAENAGVAVKQLYVLPVSRSRMVNAAAAQGNLVLLTDYLIRSMSRREVDTVVAHELTHLKRRDPRGIRLVGILTVLVAGGVRYWLNESHPETAPYDPLIAVACLGLIPPVIYGYSRFCERRADLGAVTLTGDPEAYITALARLTRLNMMPMDWGRAGGNLMTHPSTMRRVREVARHGNVPPERLADLLADRAEIEDRYELPEAVLGTDRLFTTRFKTGMTMRVFWAQMLIPPAGTALFAVASRYAGAYSLLVCAVGIPISLALCAAAVSRLAASGYQRLEPIIRSRAGNREAVFVGFAPDAEPRTYEGLANWDIGLLTLDNGRLRYDGEQIRFAVPSERIIDIDTTQGLPGWVRSPRVRVRIQDGENVRTFTLQSLGTPTLNAGAGQTEQLARDLELRLRSASGGTAPEGDGQFPSPAEVTGASPRDMRKPVVAIAGLYLSLAVGAVVGVLFGLSFAIEPLGGAWWVMVAAGLGLLPRLLPYFRYKETRIP